MRDGLRLPLVVVENEREWTIMNINIADERYPREPLLVYSSIYVYNINLKQLDCHDQVSRGYRFYKLEPTSKIN